MERTDTVVIGAGQAGLAVSNCLTEAGHDHVVLERGRLAERWRSERWDSLRLLTPNWMTQLPGAPYAGSDPEGYETAGELATRLSRYAESFAAPVQEHTTVIAVRRVDHGYEVLTDRGAWRVGHVVVATGHCDRPIVPAAAAALPPGVVQLTASSYRVPEQVPEGGVLVVGASSTGVQLADELARSGRTVTLAVGRHTRMPRRYRGMDAWWWLERIGALAQSIDEVPDPATARAQPSLQLVGRPGGANLDLETLHAVGVRIGGRLVGIDGARVELAGDLAATTATADRKLHGVLDRIDAHVAATGLDGEVLAPDPPPRVDLPAGPELIDLRAERIRTVVWATGFRREYPWLQVPVLDAAGEIRHRGGVTPSPGLYVLGLRFQRRRDSSFLHGVGYDAAFVADHILSRVGGRPCHGATTGRARP